MKGCREYAADLGLDVPEDRLFLPSVCCDSCHEDRDEGYEMVELGNGDEVCCAIANRLRGDQ